MSVSIWIINLVVLAAVLEADLGHRKITRMRLIQPLIIAAVIAAFWISGVTGSGTGLRVELAGIGTGIVLGPAAAALMKVYTADNGRMYSYAAVPYALLWVAVVAARLWFAYASNHDMRVPVGTWMYAPADHQRADRRVHLRGPGDGADQDRQPGGPGRGAAPPPPSPPQASRRARRPRAGSNGRPSRNRTIAAKGGCHG